jgi:L-serine/L-threonine ammonia-lyase
MVGKLKTLGADVHQYGTSWLEADTFLRTEVMAQDPHAVYVPPFDHPDIWEGAATIVEELDEQIGHYDGVVCSVGGGGLFSGIMQGLLRSGQRRSKPVRVLAMETEGADSLKQSVAAKTCITLPAITSIATSLGARKVAETAFMLAQREEVTCMAIPDGQAAMATVKFADDERSLIEISCGASVAPVYCGYLRETMGKGMTDEEWARQRVVIVVCGGNNVTLGILDGYRETYGERYTKMNRLTCAADP